MPFAAALSKLPDTAQALAEVGDALAGQLERPDLALVFFSAHHAAHAQRITAILTERFAPRALLGCVGEAVIGNETEVENAPGLSVWLGQWREPIELETFHLVLERTSEGHSLLGWPDALVTATPATAVMLLLGDPFSFPTDFCLGQINNDYPGLRVLGGMASGVTAPGQTCLLHNTTLQHAGAVGVLLQGPIGLRTIVSQGCRPIGRPLVITRADDNLILELGGKPPLTQLQEVWPTLTTHEQQLFQQGLHIGRVINECQDHFQRGDFLVRNVLGLDRRSGAMAITDRVRVGQTVQFHVRDAETADEDLHALLQQDLATHPRKPAGGLVFSCNGRGSRLFAAPDHDARTLRQETGPIPLAGFFAAGELGPIGGQNFIHGFTASVALFEE